MTLFRRSRLLFASLLVVWFSLSGCERAGEGGGAANPSGTAESPSAASPSDGSPSDGSSSALADRIAKLEEQMAAQAKQHAEERQLMVQALESSSQRLDVVVEAILKGAVPSTAVADAPPSAAGPASEGPRAARPPVRIGDDEEVAAGEGSGGPGNAAELHKSAKADAAAGSWFESVLEGVDLIQVLVIFLAVSLLSLVIVILFFPSRLRGPVPEVEYAALEEEAIAGLQDDAVSGGYAPETLPRADLVAPGPSPFHPVPRDEDLGIDLPTEDDAPHYPAVGQLGSPRANLPTPAHEGEPVTHDITLAVGGEDEIHALAEVLDHFLTTEPYILNEPKPQVALEDEVLHLRFFALPTLSQTEHDLLDDAVRRLRPVSAGSSARIVG